MQVVRRSEGVSWVAGQGVSGVWGAEGVLVRGRPRKWVSKAKSRPKGEGQAREASGSPKEGAPTCSLWKCPDEELSPSHCQSKAAELHWEPPGQVLACAAQRPSNGAEQLKAQGIHGEGAARTTWWTVGGWVCCVVLGTVGHRVGPVPWGCLLGFAHPALGPGRPGPWPLWCPGSQASPSYPVQGHCHPRGTATHSCPACLVLGRAQATAGSLWESPALGPPRGAREETWGWARGAWG